MAQQFGKTWWGEQWLNSLNNIDYSNRLPRGSSYARKGAVTKISITENHISAKVAGSRPKPYSVDIILPPFFKPEIDQFVDQLISKPVIISKLLNRELDPAVLNIAENMSLKVFPKQWTDFKMQCSCPDWAVPCKHLAAVIYKVSAEIDNNPFLVFDLHRVNLLDEINKRGIFVTQENSTIPKITDLYFEKQSSSKTKITYATSNAYQKLSFAKLSPIHESLLSLLSDFPVFYPGQTNFKEKYSKTKTRIVRDAQKIVQGKLNLENFIQYTNNSLNITPHTTSKLAIDKKCQVKVDVTGEEYALSEFLTQLTQIPANRISDYQPSTASLHTVFHLALHLLANGAIVPQIILQPENLYAVRWLPALLSKETRVLVEKLSETVPPDILIWEEPKREKPINKATETNLLSVFVTELVSLIQGKDTDDLFLDLFFRKTVYAFNKPGEQSLSGGIMAWLQKYYLSQGNYRPQIVVEETIKDSFLISINIEDISKPLNQPYSLRDVLTLSKFNQERFQVLQSLTQLSAFIRGLDEYINSKGEELMVMDNATFTPFLLEMIPALQLLDIAILLPKSLQQILKPKASVKLTKKPGKSFLRLDQLLDFDWQIALGDNLLNQEEFQKLLKKSDGLIKYKSQYIYVSKQELEKLHKHFDGRHDLSPFQLLRTALSGDYYGAKISLSDEIRDLIKELSEFKEIQLPTGIQATLRPYQQRGFSWMYRNAQIGFGSVIADDMGLGKTLQVITTLLKYKEEGLLTDKKALIITPTGLLTNWQAEIQKFAPGLRTHIFHGTNRTIEEGFDLLLTSYGIARTEAPRLKKFKWHTLVIDEAQNIKNQDTAQSKAIKSIGADNFIAMSGTPVENRLSELWSILDYSNRGFLGSHKEFNEAFGNPIETYNDINAAEKLKKVTAPFMMRRLKTDKSIISDLPDKIEMDCFATLVKEQASLYEKTLEEALKEIEAIDASDKKGLFVRQGLVLQMILALKQICNHPTQFLKNNVLESDLSGKLNLLYDKLDNIIDNGEKVLIFTQFFEMGKLLEYFITERYKEHPLFYHGSCSLKQRKEMVDAFQTNPADKIFILSLKAAGTGLNLTAANHVIHYDLWWNPAVEAQATDRAYRIGQKSNVMVHRFITKNTFEERINEMIQSKKALADMTVATGENWIGNLSNKELKQLFEVG